MSPDWIIVKTKYSNKIFQRSLISILANGINISERIKFVFTTTMLKIYVATQERCTMYWVNIGSLCQWPVLKQNYLRNECLFSRFMGNESQCGTNKSREPRSGSRAICLFRTAIHFPWTEKKKDTHSLYLQCLQQRFLLKFSEQSKKFKFPSEIGNLTLFPDKTYSFSQNSAWINGEKVACRVCFLIHILTVTI